MWQNKERIRADNNITKDETVKSSSTAAEQLLIHIQVVRVQQQISHFYFYFFLLFYEYIHWGFHCVVVFSWAEHAVVVNLAHCEFLSLISITTLYKEMRLKFLCIFKWFCQLYLLITFRYKNKVRKREVQMCLKIISSRTKNRSFDFLKVVIAAAQKKYYGELFAIVHCRY